MTEQDWSCESVIERLLEYLDGELPGADSTAIEQHLQRCRECFSRAEFERRLRDRVQESAEVRAPDRLRHRIARLIDQY